MENSPLFLNLDNKKLSFVCSRIHTDEEGEPTRNRNTAKELCIEEFRNIGKVKEQWNFFLLFC